MDVVLADRGVGSQLLALDDAFGDGLFSELAVDLAYGQFIDEGEVATEDRKWPI
jgi:hypothetical protein